MARGSATTDGRFAYFAPFESTSLYQYEYSTEKWLDLPPCPYHNSGLAFIDSELTTVGGWYDRSHPTNKLFTLRQRNWVMKYSPMNTARSSPAVVSTSDGDYLIVIGGYDGGHWTATVELFQVKNRRWHKLTDLPQPQSLMHTTQMVVAIYVHMTCSTLLLLCLFAWFSVCMVLASAHRHTDRHKRIQYRNGNRAGNSLENQGSCLKSF